MISFVLKNLSANRYRTGVVGLCALLLAGLSLSVVLVLRGTEASLQLASQRLGADLVVMPEGAVEKVEGALLMGIPEQGWMPASVLSQISTIPGVEQVSPQLFVTAWAADPGAADRPTFLIALDPATDFTITPWLAAGGPLHLQRGEAISGAQADPPGGGGKIEILGVPLQLVGRVEPTGTRLDQAVFVSFDTAQELIEKSSAAGDQWQVPADSLSSILVRVETGADPYAVAVEIMHQVPTVMPVNALDLFQSYRKQISTLLDSVLAVMVITLAVSVILVGLIFSMAANERRQEIGVLRAMGATRSFVFVSLLVEAGLVALAGGLPGALIAAGGVVLLRGAIAGALGVPLLLPSLAGFLPQVGAGIAAALVVITLAALLPSFRISRQEPAFAMRE